MIYYEEKKTMDGKPGRNCYYCCNLYNTVLINIIHLLSFSFKNLAVSERPSSISFDFSTTLARMDAIVLDLAAAFKINRRELSTRLGEDGEMEQNSGTIAASCSRDPTAVVS